MDGEPYDGVAGAGDTVTGVALEVTSGRVEMRFPSGLDDLVTIGMGGVLMVNTYVPVDLGTAGLLGNNNGDMGDDWRVRELCQPLLALTMNRYPRAVVRVAHLLTQQRVPCLTCLEA